MKLVGKIGGVSAKKTSQWIQNISTASEPIVDDDAAIVVSFDNMQQQIGTSRSCLHSNNKNVSGILPAKTSQTGAVLTERLELSL